MIQFAIIFGVAFLFVGLRAFQQLNVQHGRELWVIPTSLLMALCEVTIVAAIVKAGMAAVLPLGLGAGLGCIAAMRLHQHMRGASERKDMGH